MTWRRVAWALTACVALGAVAFVLLAPTADRAASASPGAPDSSEQSIGLFDPHLHLGLVESRVLGSGQRLVTLRARSDAARIEIDLGRLGIEVFDGAGNRFLPRVLPGADGVGALSDRLRGTLHGGDSVTQSFVFEIPDDARGLTLALGCSDGPGRWLPRSWVRTLGECALFDLG